MIRQFFLDHYLINAIHHFPSKFHLNHAILLFIFLIFQPLILFIELIQSYFQNYFIFIIIQFLVFQLFIIYLMKYWTNYQIYYC